MPATKQTNFRFNPRTLQMLKWIADDMGITQPNVLRILITEVYNKRRMLKKKAAAKP